MSRHPADPRSRIIVVGAGIAGLTAAFRLQTLGYDVTVLECEDHVGGRMRTISHQGYRLDLGAIWLSQGYSHMLSLASDAGLTAHIEPTSSTIGLVRDGLVHRLRLDRRSDLARTRLLSMRSKVRALALLRDGAKARPLLSWDDLSTAAQLDSEDARAYALRRLNPELLDYLIDPLSRVCYFLPPEQVSAAGIHIGMSTLFGAGTFNFTDGIDTLPRLLADQLTVTLGARVIHVRQNTNGVQVRWEDAQRHRRTENAAACVLAVPAPTAANLVPDLPDTHRDYLAGLEYLHGAHIYFGVTRPVEEEATFVVFPTRENPHVSYVVFHPRCSPGRVPPGHGLVTIKLDGELGEKHRHTDDPQVAADALDCLDDVLPQAAHHIRSHLDMTFVHRWEQAIVHRSAGGYHLLQQFTGSYPSSSRIQFAGDHMSFSSTNAAIATGQSAAQRTAHALHREGKEMDELR
ncbi:protoporphyrinogen/coproporphyrinogen oxidase [Streptomyces sp. NRRL B-1347]|uniref:protoporphyrinogen/coproporphyrinogen oxidase n=1 Tax=Streptomyces sp. NRRL B-1347 TaxID=1476877 RepID=UPI00068FB095|nr:NAD(P)/FAD-dependent oxidoreductase [Streptomyces sp. NRRL B-1347]